MSSPGDPICPLPLDAVSFTSKLWRKLDLKARPDNIQCTTCILYMCVMYYTDDIMHVHVVVSVARQEEGTKMSCLRWDSNPRLYSRQSALPLSYQGMYMCVMYIRVHHCVLLQVYFMQPHAQQIEILQWAAEWSRYCAILFYHTTQAADSDIRIDFNEGEISPSIAPCTCTCF